MPDRLKTAVVSGANRGLGLEICRQLSLLGIRTILTSRDEAKGKHAADLLRTLPGEVIYHQLDVSDPGSIELLHEFVKSNYGAADILVNNAGILPDEGDRLLDMDVEVFREVMAVNFYGALLLCQAFIPDMLRQNYGRVVNVSSGSGQVGPIDTGMVAPAYKTSKLALNALTRLLAREVQGSRVLVNAVCPGWVRTGMGGAQAPRTVERGAETIVWLATLPEDGPQGGFFRDRKHLEW